MCLPTGRHPGTCGASLVRILCIAPHYALLHDCPAVGGFKKKHGYYAVADNRELTTTHSLDRSRLSSVGMDDFKKSFSPVKPSVCNAK